MPDSVKTRITHVWRAKCPNNENIWLDIERVDGFVTNEEGQGQLYRKTTRLMDWLDETSEEPPVNREANELRVRHHDDDDEESDQYVPVYVIDKQKTRRQDGKYQSLQKWFVNNKGENEIREFSVRRVYHWDTETDPNDKDGDYIRIEDTEDRSQYSDVALFERIIRTSRTGTHKKQTIIFNTDPIKEYSEPTPEDEIDLEKVIWLDPWQNIINVQWGHPFLLLGRMERVVLESPGVIAKSSDGITWTQVEWDGPYCEYGAWGNGVFLIASTDIGPSGTGPIVTRMWTSRGGTTWDEVVGHPFSSLYIVGIEFGNDVFVAVGKAQNVNGQPTIIGVSEDGVTWTSTVWPHMNEDTNMQTLGFSGGKFVLGGGQRYGGGVPYRILLGWDFIIGAPAGTPIWSGIITDSGTTHHKSRVSVSSDGVTWSAPVDAFAWVSVTDNGIPMVEIYNPNTGVTFFHPLYDPPDINGGDTTSTNVLSASRGDGPDIFVRPGLSGGQGISGRAFAKSSDGGGSWVMGGTDDMRSAGDLMHWIDDQSIPEDRRGDRDKVFVADGTDGQALESPIGFYTYKAVGGGWSFSTLHADLATRGVAQQHTQPKAAFGKGLLVMPSFASDSANNPEIWTTPDGVNWTQREHRLLGQLYTKVIY